MTTNKEIMDELKKIREDTRFSSFDTIYTSVLVLVISLSLTLLISGKLESGMSSAISIFLVIMLGISLLLQFVSVFTKKKTETIKYLSLIIVLLSLGAIAINLFSKSAMFLSIIYVTILILFVIIKWYFNNLK